MRFAIWCCSLVACSSAPPQPPPAPLRPVPVDAAPASDGGCKKLNVDEVLLREGSTWTKEDCECAGARVNLSRGGGAQAHCDAGERDIGPVRLGLEGGWCCWKER